MKIRRKAQFYRALAAPDAIDRRSSNRPKPVLGFGDCLGRFHQGPVEYLASWDLRKAADGRPSAAPESEQTCEDARIAPAVRNWSCLLLNVVIQYRLRFVLLNQSVQNSASA